jgi:hypothetical protein
MDETELIAFEITEELGQNGEKLMLIHNCIWDNSGLSVRV